MSISGLARCPFISCSVAQHLGNRSGPARPGPQQERDLSCPFSEASFNLDGQDLPLLLLLALGCPSPIPNACPPGTCDCDLIWK